MLAKVKEFSFLKNKYGEELLVDLVPLNQLENYFRTFPSHRLHFYDITLVQEGSGTFSLDHYLFELKPNSVYFTAPAQIRHWKISQFPTGYALIFEEEFVSSFFKDSLFVKKLACFNYFSFAPCLELKQEESEIITGLFRTLEKELYSPEKDEHLLRAILCQALMLLNRMFVVKSTGHVRKDNNSYAEKFVLLVNESFASHRSVEYYADKLHVTSGHLNDMVKRIHGISAKQYILNRVFLEAKRLLLYTDISIDELAGKLCYDTSSYFIRAFKAHQGTTPYQFRKTHLP